MLKVIFFLFITIFPACGGSGAQGSLTVSDDATTTEDTLSTEGMGTVYASSDSFSAEMTTENLAFTEATSETYRLKVTVKPYDLAAESANFTMVSESLPSLDTSDDEE